ncbi:amidohydrolase family protein [Bacillus sp. EB01]|uniref:amidohydrolase family protein n=1 Tax=Bacillus sp. EB01 TaxID=1347086 RepID=UPI0005C4E99F|nr:amidohydrolase family protein [Bacillus sp. EB01]
MDQPYLVRGKKIVTVSHAGTIHDGAMAIMDGKILEVGNWNEIRKRYPTLPVRDYSDFVITPSLVDCHTHLLEFAPSSLYPVTQVTHFMAGKAILLKALSSGITALGEQVCGHPLCNFSITDYKNAIKGLPLDVTFAATSISIGFEQMAHFTFVTQSRPVDQRTLSDPDLVKRIAAESEYPGENIFINATPANFTADQVPRAGEIIYTVEELKSITDIYQQAGKRIGAHVAGEEGISMALDVGIDVLHHAHGITYELIEKAATQNVSVVATPMGGTHLEPNSPENILSLVKNNIPVSISTDAYLPPYPGTTWLPFHDSKMQGPDTLMLIAHPAMRLLEENNYTENEILALLTVNPAKILGKESKYGSLETGKDANFLVAEGIPGLQITDVEKIKRVFFKGVMVIERK